MEHSPAPFHEDLADGPPGGAAWWCTTSDNVRIRVALWPCADAKGTVLLFPGRTEYIEKYGRAAADFVRRGYAVLCIDWRGQGLADRLLDKPDIGHVTKFLDYQNDVAAALDLATAHQMPEPWFLLGHSMGGGIGLRAAMQGLPVRACAFTGPMWGIQISPMMRPLAAVLPTLAGWAGMREAMAPSTSSAPYVLANPFEGNMLTPDPDMYRWMQTHLESHPELSLGGPSIHWLAEALEECRLLAQMPAPALPCITLLGKLERIVDTGAVHTRMAGWPNGTLEEFEGSEHEVLMDTPETRKQAFDKIDALFSGA